jgi:hypothetical protein
MTLESSSIWMVNHESKTYEQHMHTTYMVHMDNGVIFIKKAHANENCPEGFGPAGCIMHRGTWEKGRWEPMTASFLNGYLSDLPFFVQTGPWGKEGNNYLAPGKDSHGRQVVLKIEKTKEDYLIGVQYSNLSFHFFADETDMNFADLDWRNDPLTPYNLLEKGKTYRENPDYTDEELEKFFSPSQAEDKNLRAFETLIKTSLLPTFEF